ncbi:hypothetical protein EVAR_55053_1 [Eumeta japonica]|uniref:Uncharacterized protein n=1 Tax=Eumeta variegata TaxID=151549 RepID=A0A4C1ZTJ4_EUMVA|nr:hypothetical protein EVAR_55053_1 [Eumeta japonica]
MSLPGLYSSPGLLCVSRDTHNDMNIDNRIDDVNSSHFSDETMEIEETDEEEEDDDENTIRSMMGMDSVGEP